MYSKPYNNSRDMRIMKRDINPVEKDDNQTELEKQMQALTLKIETLMRSQAQVPIITPSFPTWDRCGIMHGTWECIVDDKLVATIDEINFVRGENNSYNQYPKKFNQGQGFRKDQEER